MCECFRIRVCIWTNVCAYFCIYNVYACLYEYACMLSVYVYMCLCARASSMYLLALTTFSSTPLLAVNLTYLLVVPVQFRPWLHRSKCMVMWCAGHWRQGYGFSIVAAVPCLIRSFLHCKLQAIMSLLLTYTLLSSLQALCHPSDTVPSFGTVMFWRVGEDRI